MPLQHLRSSTANKRPVPGNMSEGQLGINTNTGSPGLFFKDSNNTLVKVGPVHVGTTAPNASPASGGTAGNSVGEQWLDTTGGTYVFKVWDGSAWRSESGTFVDVNGDVMTGALGIIAGSAAAPGLYFSGDTNTGIYSPGADQVAISTNGTGRLFVDANGNVGIGATSPARKLDISNGDIRLSDGYVIEWGAAGNTIFGNSTSNFLAFSSSGNERARIDSSGKLLVGTSSARSGFFNGSTYSSNVQVEKTSNAAASYIDYSAVRNTNDNEAPFIVLGKSRGATNGAVTVVSADDYLGSISFQGADGAQLCEAVRISAYVDGTPGTDDMPGRLTFSTTADGASSPTERMRIDSAGAIYFQTTATPSTSSYGTVITSGNVFLHSRNTTSAVAQFYGSSGEFRVLGTGNVQNTNNSYGAISDAKLKENIAAAGSQWDDLKALEVVNFNFIGSDQRQIGLVAQQVELISPGLVEDVPDDEAGTTSTKGVKYSVLYMKAVKALQEAMERIEALEARIAAAGI
jgi:hypothetical protein